MNFFTSCTSPALICEGGVYLAGSAGDVGKNLPAEFILTRRNVIDHCFFIAKRTGNPPEQITARRILDTFDRSKVSGEILRNCEC